MIFSSTRRNMYVPTLDDTNFYEIHVSLVVLTKTNTINTLKVGTIMITVSVLINVVRIIY